MGDCRLVTYNGFGSEAVDMADAIYILQYLFAGGAALPCEKAADANDDNGAINLGDSVYILQYLFANGPEIPPPFPLCGSDTTEDDLSCEQYGPCP